MGTIVRLRYENKYAWWVADAEIEGSATKGACAILEVVVNGTNFDCCAR